MYFGQTHKIEGELFEISQINSYGKILKKSGQNATMPRKWQKIRKHKKSNLHNKRSTS